MEGDAELLAATEVKPVPKRDEWMTTLPPEKKVRDPQLIENAFELLDSCQKKFKSYLGFFFRRLEWPCSNQPRLAEMLEKAAETLQPGLIHLWTKLKEQK